MDVIPGYMDVILLRIYGCTPPPPGTLSWGFWASSSTTGSEHSQNDEVNKGGSKIKDSSIFG